MQSRAALNTFLEFVKQSFITIATFFPESETVFLHGGAIKITTIPAKIANTDRPVIIIPSSGDSLPILIAFNASDKAKSAAASPK